MLVGLWWVYSHCSRFTTRICETAATARVAERWERGRGSSRSKKSSQAPPSVTSVVFIDEYVLASAGANDGAVKLWDLRKSWNHEVPCVVTVRL
jgi:WD40 repeat protein